MGLTRNAIVKKGIAVVLGASSLLLTTGATSADAITTTSSGCVGASTAYVVQGQGFQNQPGLLLHGPNVVAGTYNPSAGPCINGTQTISMTRRVWLCVRTSCAWGLSSTQTWTSGSVQPGQQVTFRPTSLRYGTSRVALSVDVTLTWRDWAGRVVGTKYLDYNLANDYLCDFYSRSMGYCGTGTDPVMGAVIYEV